MSRQLLDFVASRLFERPQPRLGAARQEGW